jgi:glycosyltransferase involved in cell wall biosynthesis
MSNGKSKSATCFVVSSSAEALSVVGSLPRGASDPAIHENDKGDLPSAPGTLPEISVVIPIYNEELNIPELRARLEESLNALGIRWEVVVVNDGSTDGTEKLLDVIAKADNRFVVVHFRRNFGQTAAISAGIRFARGEIVIPMDGDLQNDPKDIGRLLKKMGEGYDVVSGWRKKRNDPITKIIPSRIANAVISVVTRVRLHDYGCSLKAYRRDVLKDVFLYGEMHRFVPVYAAMRGARVTEIPVQHFPRTRGESKYGLGRIGKVLLDLVVVKFFLSFMTKPIYLFGGLGIFFSVCSGVALTAAIVFKLIPVDNPWGPHWHKDFVATPLPLLAGFLVSLGVVMTLQGVLAEMIMRTYYESQGKDPYNILRVRNASAKDEQICVG